MKDNIMYEYRQNMIVMDIETYPNYFLVDFRDIQNQSRTKRFEMRSDDDKLDIVGIKKMLRSATVITFNGNHYDMPMLMYAFTGARCTDLKEASDMLIGNRKLGLKGIPSWQFMKTFELQYPAYLDHIDIFEIPAGTLSLKAYAARIGCVKLQDLPINPDDELTEAQKDIIAEYCDNDTMNTVQLFLHKDVKRRVDLRCDISRQYGIDMRSKSDAQVGEAVFKSTIERQTGKRLYKPDFNTVKKRFKYDIPEFISFSHPNLVKLLDVVRNVKFEVGQYGHVLMPQELSDMKIDINQGLYTIGIGGLHSNESEQAIVAADDEFIKDADVGSFYPSIIINGGYYPSQLGLPFLNNYKKFRDDRLAMKHDETKKTIVETYKIVLNGSFGKLSSMYSFLYSPKMLIQVTLTGQLCLLMLIERMEAVGLRIVSANTDGIVIYGKKHQEHLVDEIVGIWEIETGYIMEYTPYAAIYSQGVNSYLALKPYPMKKEPFDNWKRKGDYAERGLTQSGNGQVCIEAVMQYLEHGAPVRETIEKCTDFLKFTNFQQVKGGAYKDGKYLGKVVRWYYSTETTTAILNSSNGTVPLTKGAMPCMELPDRFPSDIDYNWYVREAYSMLDRLGVKGVEREAKAFGLVKGAKPVWARKFGQQTWHLIDLATKEALCEARLKDRHDDWEYSHVAVPETGRLCGKCKKK